MMAILNICFSGELAQMLTAQGLYNHSTTTLEEEEAALFGMA